MNENIRSNSLYAGSQAAGQAIEAERGIPVAMTQLASALGDLETAARALAGRISPLLPAGSPFERTEKYLQETNQATNVPQPARSGLCSDLHARIYGLQAITANLQQMVKGIEI